MIQMTSLSKDDYVDAARALGTDEAVVRSVVAVESNGKGLGDDGRPVILFEPHQFSRLTNHQFDKTHGGVSYPSWGDKPYPRTQAARWDQLEYAAKLDHDAAYLSASYGLFQIMGFNHEACGFPTVGEFVNAMRTERGQLMAFVAFVKANARMHKALCEKDWPMFAASYNGPGFRKNQYDAKLAAAYKRYSAGA
jgi:hypothetical protein